MFLWRSTTLAFLLFCLAVLFLVGASATAGTVRPPLDEMLAKSNPDERISVIAVLADRVDNVSLNQSLKAREATFAQRHYEVITTLQQKATLTQGPVLRALDDLEVQGKVSDIKNYWITNAIGFEGTPEAIREIASLDIIEEVVFDFPVELIKPTKTGEQPVIATHSQGLDVINAPEVWAMGYTGAGRLVSNIDTGVDGTHPALSSRWRGNNGQPASECWFDPVYGYSTPTDHGQHGTHTMGTICGRSSTTYDTVGVAINAQWIAAGSVDYGGTTSDIIASFQWIADPDGNPLTTDDVPDVVGNSWGYSPFFHGVPHCDNTFWAVMDGCENAGVVVIFSAGNEGAYGANSLRTPADRATTYFNAFSVGAIDGHNPSYPIADFSSLGPCQCASGDMNIKPECVAPGVNVYSSVPGGGYEGDWSGTSMASPHISGAVAILRQVNPSLDVNQIKSILLQSCVNLGPSGEDNTYGHGVLDLQAAVMMALTGVGFIDGYVRDAVYSMPLPALVQIVGSSIQTTANSSGYYILAVPPDTTYTVRASYQGYVTQEAQVAVVVDDTTTQNFFLPPPLMSYYPASYNVSVPPGQTLQRDLVIKNVGQGTLYFNTWPEVYSALMRDVEPQPPAALPEPLGYHPADASKAGSIPEPYYPPMILDQGGPDAFGHTWIDSDEPGGPPVTWVDISSQGTEVFPGEDGSVGPLSIGFSFPFFNNNYSQLYINSNGIITFGSGTTDYSNDPIPSSATPNNFIAPWWDDLSPQNAGWVKYYYDAANSRFIVSYVGVPNWSWSGGTGSLTFQAVLHTSGRIDLNYGTMNPGDDDLQSATAGIENQAGNDGLQIAYNQAYMHSNLSIVIMSNNWLSVSPQSGSVPAGDSVIATVTFDATDLAVGVYTGNINLTSNAPVNNNADIPVTLNVTEVPAPLIELNVSAIYDTVYSGQSTTFDLIVTNSGTANLTYSLTDDRTWITENPTGGTILPSQSQTVVVTFNATSLAPGAYTGTITVSSNDSNQPTINVPCYLRVNLLITDDVGITSILNPVDSMLVEVPYDVKAVVRNYGIDPQSFNAIYEVGLLGSLAVIFADTLPVNNMPAASIDTITFGDAFTATAETTYTFKVYTVLSGDQVPANDVATRNVRSYSVVSIWYGNLSGTPIAAAINDRAPVDVYIFTPATAFIADLHLCLGTDDDFVDSLLSVNEGQVYYPLTEWEMAEFLEPSGSPPNPAGWSSQSFIGFARLNPYGDGPWLHVETPTRIMTFMTKIVNDTDLIGQIRAALGPGINPVQGSSNAGDTIGGAGYRLDESFSPMHFIESFAGAVNVYYGNVNGNAIGTPIGGRAYVEVYFETPAEAYVADMHICLGTDDRYIDSLLSVGEGQVHYPLTEWEMAEFLAPESSPPNPAGWSSQSFIGVARLNPYGDAPWLHSLTPLRVLTFTIKSADDPGLDGLTRAAIGPGINSLQGPSNAGDTLGLAGYALIESFSPLYFTLSAGCDYVPGDVNGDGNVIGSDVTYAVNYLRTIGAPPPDSCYNQSTSSWHYAAADANGDCDFLGSDITYLVMYFRMVNPNPLWCPQTPPLNPPQPAVTKGTTIQKGAGE